MTLNSTHNKELYVGSAGLVYPYTFKIWKAADLQVIRSDVAGIETVLTLDVDYTVDGVGDPNGGNVTLIGAQAVDPPSTGEKLGILRVLSITQEVDWVENDPSPSDVLEGSIDRLTAIAQQHEEEISRCMKIGITAGFEDVDPTQLAADAAAAIAAADRAETAAASAEADAASLNIPSPTVSDAGKVVAVNPAGAFTLQQVSSSGSDLYLFNNVPALGGNWR
jgi:hypothetical protein